MRVSNASSAVYGIAARAVQQAQRPVLPRPALTLQHVPDPRERAGSSWTHGLVGRALHETLVSGFVRDLDRNMQQRGGYPELAPYPDPTVEGTAQRIAGSAGMLYEIWRRQNPDVDSAQAIEHFEQVMRGAVNVGYKQAVSVIQGLSMDARDARDADRIVGLVHLELDGFFAGLRADAEERASDPGRAPAAHPEASTVPEDTDR